MVFVDSNESWEGKISLISTKSGGDIYENENLAETLSSDIITRLILKKAKKGTPLIEMGKGYPKVMIIAGVHGNELPPQLAALKFVQEISDRKLWGTTYIIPFAAPGATVANTRWFDGVDLNRASSRNGSVTNNIVKLIQMLKIESVADFHSTKLRSNPGRESVFCSKNPCPESHEIAYHITESTSSELICYDKAGSIFNGALEDECNLRGIPAVTCEVVSENGEITPGSTKRSLLQMHSYLEHFNIIR